MVKKRENLIDFAFVLPVVHVKVKYSTESEES